MNPSATNLRAIRAGEPTAAVFGAGIYGVSSGCREVLRVGLFPRRDGLMPGLMPRRDSAW
jgi:hypothetical protein